MTEEKGKEKTLPELCNEILEILQEIREAQKTMIENQTEIFKQVGGKLV